MSETEKRIAAIQAARARNNGHWMDYLRLAHRVAPDEAMEIAARINAVDEEILALNGRLGTQDHWVVGIQARMSSTRLPGKVMADICGKPMIQRVWDACAGPWRRVVLTSTDASDDVLCTYMDRQMMAYMRGSLEDVLSRYLDAIKAFRPRRMARVCADEPFIKSEWIHATLEHPHERVYFAGALHAGTSDEWFRSALYGGGSREHAASDAFEFGALAGEVPADYFSVNTPEDLERARTVWASRASS